MPTTKILKGMALVMCAIVAMLTATTARAALAHNSRLPTVVVVATGGTIAEATDPTTGAAVPTLTGDSLTAAVPGLAKLANIEVVNLCNIDSSQMTPEIWVKLSAKVDEVLKRSNVAGAVVTHGTDTMAEGAYFLDLTLRSRKPVAFVGAMRDASDVSPDGPANILNAVTQLLSPEARSWGVTVTLNEYVCSARDVRKTQTTNVQTFTGGEKGYLGYIAMGKVQRFNDRPARLTLPIPTKLPDVVLITQYAGDDGRFIRHAVESGAAGIVVEGVGAGNVNAANNAAIVEALKRGIPVVVTSRVENGAVMPIYGDEGGGASLAKEGAILAGDLPGPKARLLLMLALPQVGNDRHRLTGFFRR